MRLIETTFESFIPSWMGRLNPLTIKFPGMLRDGTGTGGMEWVNAFAWWYNSNATGPSIQWGYSYYSWLGKLSREIMQKVFPPFWIIWPWFKRTTLFAKSFASECRWQRIWYNMSEMVYYDLNSVYQFGQVGRSRHWGLSHLLNYHHGISNDHMLFDLSCTQQHATLKHGYDFKLVVRCLSQSSSIS